MAPRRRNEPTGSDVVADARRYFGVPYRYGGTDRRSGLDCSGLVLVVCEDIGIKDCPRTSEEQFVWVQKVDSNAIGPGDLVFLVGAEIDPPPGHVGIVSAPGRFIDAPFTGAVVREDSYSLHDTGVNKVLGFGRIPGVQGSSSANPNVTGQKQQNTSDQSIGGAIGVTVGWLVFLLMFAIIIAALALLAMFVLK